jgi:glycosyltransferase involved in cell wall biosynthesis
LTGPEERERSNLLVSVCLPVRNGAEQLANAVSSVLAQDYEDLELVISDNASTDHTEEICRELARSDSRIVYQRQAENIGLLNNFIASMRMSTGAVFRWIGHDDWLHPNSISRSLEPLMQDDRRILVTTRVAYIDEDGVTRTDDSYDGADLASEDPVVRLTEMLRLLNESRLLLDPLYGLFRRSPVLLIPRRNMVKEDEVFAAKLALAGPWAHVPEVLVHRTTREEPLSNVARRLDVAAWEAHVAGALQCRELLRWLQQVSLTPEQRRRAKAAVWRMYLRRQRRTVAHRTRRAARAVAGLRRRR